MQVFNPNQYEAYVDELCKNLIDDLKNERIDSAVFAETYAKYQQLKSDNAREYAKLNEETRSLVDSYSERLLELEQRGLNIKKLELKIKELEEKNRQLHLKVSNLQNLLSRHPFEAPSEFDPMDLLNPNRIFY